MGAQRNIIEAIEQTKDTQCCKKIITICLVVASIVCLFVGCVHTHSWVEASCLAPQTCKTCGEAMGEPKEHAWVAATCESKKYCAYCGKTEGQVLQHNWVGGTSKDPAVCTICKKMKALSMPRSGQVFIGDDLYCHSELSITSATTQSCYIKLKNAVGQDVFSFFVRAGDSVVVDVPSGYYYVYFSYGTEWYGTKYLFGENTTYSKDDEICDFENYTWEYTLQPVVGGNFSETPVDAEEFK